MKGRRRLKISQMSISFTYDVFGMLFETEVNIVVSTSMAVARCKIYCTFIKCCKPVRFTVTTASKKKGLKKLVAWPMIFRRIVGRYTVKIVPRSLRPKVMEILKTLMSFKDVSSIMYFLT